MTRMTLDGPRGRVVIGVDTHKHVHVAAAMIDLGTALDTRRFPADSAGYLELIDWSRQFGHLITYGIDGTGSYGVGLTSAVRRSGIRVIEVVRTDRRDRRLRGKSDTIDAENAAGPCSPARPPRSPRPRMAQWK